MQDKTYVPFTEAMKQTHTILVPNMLPNHFKLIISVFRTYGYHMELLEDDGWLTGSGADYIELELEDEKVNPKYGILTVKNYLQKAQFAPDTTIELAGTPVGIYE